MKPFSGFPAVISVGLVASILSAATPEKAPVAPVVPVTDDYFGRKIVDPYRYMENLKDPAVQSWIKAQADYTSSVLSLIPGREKLLVRLHELNTSATARISGVNVLLGLLFYEKTLASENVARLYMRRGIQGEERLILDPTRLDKPGGPAHVVNYYVPSWNGQYVVAGISEGGSEQAVIHIVETGSAQELPETIDRAPFGIVAWKDSKSFFYHRLQRMLPGMPDTEKQLKSTVWLHTLGVDVEKDLPVFGYDRSPATRFDPIDIPIIATSPDASFAVGIVAHGVKNEATLYVAPLASMSSGSGVPWKKVVDVDDEITDMATHGDDVYRFPTKTRRARRF